MAITINGNGTIGGITAGGLPDDSITAAELGTKTFVSYAAICDQKAENADGGTFTLGDWRIRDLNTEITDADGIVSISSNQFTLGAGSYLIEWAAPAERCGGHQSRLYDITASNVAQYGQSSFSDSGGDGSGNVAPGIGRVVISSSNTYEIQHRCSTTRATSGFGRAVDFSGNVEIYTIVNIYKEA